MKNTCCTFLDRTLLRDGRPFLDATLNFFHFVKVTFKGHLYDNVIVMFSDLMLTGESKNAVHLQVIMCTCWTVVSFHIILIKNKLNLGGYAS